MSRDFSIAYKGRIQRFVVRDVDFLTCPTAGLHNSESSKGQIDQHKLAAGRKNLFRHSVEEILKGQVIIRSRAFATFSATEFSRAACGPRAVSPSTLTLKKP